MGTDRFIEFPPGKKPSGDDVVTALTAYVNGVGEITRHTPTYASVKLPGEVFTVAGAFPGNEWLNAPSPLRRKDRCIEVDVTGRTMIITTRGADEFTSALAEGFVEFATRYWSGKRILEDKPARKRNRKGSKSA